MKNFFGEVFFFRIHFRIVIQKEALIFDFIKEKVSLVYKLKICFDFLWAKCATMVLKKGKIAIS